MDEPEELEPVLEPIPVLPAPDVLLSGEVELLLGVLALSDELELLGALVLPLEELEL